MRHHLRWSTHTHFVSPELVLQPGKYTLHRRALAEAVLLRPAQLGSFLSRGRLWAVATLRTLAPVRIRLPGIWPSATSACSLYARQYCWWPLEDVLTPMAHAVE